MRVVATLCALGVAATLGADPPHQCEPDPHAFDAFTDLLERDWWRLSPKDLDGIWPHPLRDTGCGEPDFCLDRTWCGLSQATPDECVCSDQLSFAGPKRRLKLAFFVVAVRLDPDEARETALRLGDAFEATGRATRVECADVLSGAVACHQWPSEIPGGKVVATSLWIHERDGQAELSAEASVVAREP
jgi:hypothetical protein